MKRIYNIFCGLLLLILLFFGILSIFDKDPSFSESENRELKTFPRITISSLIDGSFTTALREYYADTFPLREQLMESNELLKGFYGLNDPSSEDDAPPVTDYP